MSTRLALRASSRLSQLQRITTPRCILPASRYMSTNPPPKEEFGKTFRGQLYESTARRVQAEKEASEVRLNTGKTTGTRSSNNGATLAGLFGVSLRSPSRFFY